MSKQLADTGMPSPPFLAYLTEDSTQLVISGAEADHIIKSRRMQVEQEICLTNGRGHWANAVIEVIDRKKSEVVVRVLRIHRAAPKKSTKTSTITLATAIPKGDRQSVLIGMATQLGVDKIVPLHCEFSATRFSENMGKRWRNLVIEAGKQSRRAIFPQILQPLSVQQAIDEGMPCIVADAQGESVQTLDKSAFGDEVMLLVGPEGGFSPQERRLLDAENVLKLRVGEFVLRTETAAVAIITLVGNV